MKRTKTKERYTTISGTFEQNFWANMYRLVPSNPITYRTIKIERHEE